ncbi:MAG: hypothetical protein FD130_51 [Halothiobacillaceae bacterium]|nr:MAG: hypothetical protein FD130_51 [Halothiobacillaceae bacterium]
MNRGSVLIVGLCLLTPTLSQAVAPETPELELLEFLGEWSGEGEAWIKQQTLEQEKAVAAPKTEVKKDE